MTIWLRKRCRVCDHVVPHRLSPEIMRYICSSCISETVSDLPLRPMTFKDYIDKLDNYWGNV